METGPGLHDLFSAEILQISRALVISSSSLELVKSRSYVFMWR